MNTVTGGSRDDQSGLTDAALAADLAAAAGELLLGIREEIGFDQPWMLGNAGDRRTNSLLLSRLRAERPGDAVLSEEEHDDRARLKAGRVWIIDPLDGTREFSTAGRDDWAVHIALWQRPSGGSADGRCEITDAAVALPARGNRVYRSDTVVAGDTISGVPSIFRIAVSATRPPAILHQIRQMLAIEPVTIGSAGAKAMAVVDGHVDAYLHAGGQWEWDSAAPAGVVLAAGMHASRLDGSPLRYNQLNPYLPDFLMCRAEIAPILLGAICEAWR
ncbi:3'(2'),5'-bisphosphate nucleotidase CysQ [Mycobacterium uberis]|uniref:3'(2'),5-bisphosphonucleoside 3'(2')-phosphohydrolase n=1 Tax=Mycobacterium uberis TaxID=2162698 RepID=A0A3E1HBN6_9MYCO|nr:inositol monophosphatase family protein [Mycobacterium uberis]RFD23836.1 3'(2'),5'-bisphosphate nucleotidase CysQ [Mycobacterium uberis]